MLSGIFLVLKEGEDVGMTGSDQLILIVDENIVADERRRKKSLKSQGVRVEIMLKDVNLREKEKQPNFEVRMNHFRERTRFSIDATM